MTPINCTAHLHIEPKGQVGFLHDPPLGVCVELQLVHPAAVQLLEGLGAVDAFELIEAQAFSCGRQLQGALGHLPQHLPPREVSHVARVGVGHEKRGLVPADSPDAVHVSLSCGRDADLTLPVLAVEELQIPSQSVAPVELVREVERGKMRMLFVPLDLLFHGGVREE